MSDRERGFIVIHRRIESWSLWKAMNVSQRMVWVQMLLAANWAPTEVWVGEKRVQVPRGSFLDTQESIAEAAGVSRKVVRTTGSRLELERAIARATVGHEKGRAVVMTTIVNYSRYQDLTPDEGLGGAVAWSEDGATAGPRRGHGGARSEPDQPTTLSLRAAGEAARQAILDTQPLDALFPATAAVLLNLRGQGIFIKHAQDPEDRAAIEQAIAEVTTTVATQRVAENFRLTKRASMGWHLEAITGKQARASAPKRGMATPSNDHSSPEATTL